MYILNFLSSAFAKPSKSLMTTVRQQFSSESFNVAIQTKLLCHESKLIKYSSVLFFDLFTRFMLHLSVSRKLGLPFVALMELNLAFSVPLRLCFAYGGLNSLDDFVARLEGIVFCKYMADVLHAGLHTLCHKAKHPVGTEKQTR